MAFDLERLERDMGTGLLQLLVLATIRRDQPIHGYGLIKAMDAATGRSGWWKEGTVYPLLARLEKQGVLRSRWGQSGPGARRKLYELTGNGQRVVELAAGRWGALRDAVTSVLEEEA